RRLARARVRRARRRDGGGSVLRVRAARLRGRGGVVTEVVVIGAGVAGLSAAWHAARRDPDVRVTVVEASARAGGLVETERTADGFVLEHGPDSLMRTKPVAMHVVNELGLEGDLVGPGERK